LRTVERLRREARSSAVESHEELRRLAVEGGWLLRRAGAQGRFAIERDEVVRYGTAAELRGWLEGVSA
jgi:hypothetical protein